MGSFNELLQLEGINTFYGKSHILHGLSLEELTQEEIDYHDPDYPIIVTVCARKPG